MGGCVKLMDKLGKTGGQAGRLYTLCTGAAYTSLFFIRRPSTDLSALRTVCGPPILQNLSVKFSYAHFTQDLLMQLNKESY